MIRNIQLTKELNWINIKTNDKLALGQFYETHEIDAEIVDYSLDKNERAHLDYDQATNTFVLIFNVLNRTKVAHHYETIPMTFIVKDNTLLTVSNQNNHYICEMMIKQVASKEISSLFHFLFSSLFLVVDSFFPYVEAMDQDIKRINTKLKEKTTKQNLLSLSDLDTGIIYLVSSSKQNVVLIEQVKAHQIFRLLTEVEKERLDDVLIETKQLSEMAQLSSQILQQLSGTYNNILNNNLNDTMKILTVLSILMTIPTIITGFFGMNMPLPLEHNVFGWGITLVMSAIVWGVLSVILRRIIK
ncbi:MAG: magnesium transporter CorA family protein [Lactococcus sp.]|jgi:Mg2+ and Co2+ transporter CorA|uniref:Magnesium transporter, CorA family protein n=1 Tax=Pseudolactococcus piscium MKFS47 TaxID=297352 RepID=A0A0D6DZQ9_9LACT|nr:MULTISPECIES: magnesium transporter CorA family protein [Lactococcus]MBR6895368.1 magnesium transporter CorA family protein [Lactococcus sp.]MCJ1972135.1 magnesium transporter CorA family protein [Lactococcus carnosus]MDN5404206.1 magnesium transporter CorA family protein [Lactococcus sp.]MDN5409637.1 magnesium transporter CorA family protein [Lactococcus sp.]MDN5412807.1 magnesium transporter CorA family protein [Lactococcus sp.]